MHFLISGIPASGKSTFSRWLEEKKGFLHVDVEKSGVLDRYGLTTAWDTLCEASASAAPFIEALEKFKRPVVIDWGFPPEHLDAVRKLFDGGVMLWWFAADWAVARRKFELRR
jgi:broad-specificity NMP kinase